MRGSLALLGATSALALALTGTAAADTIGPITFEPPAYSTGDINGQQGWQKLNPAFDVAVANVSGFANAAGFGFGTQALRVSDIFTSGTFGDQTYSPSLANDAGETGAFGNGFSGGTR